MNKLLGMSRSPYEYTLYLDTDTYIYADISEMFSILKKFDIAVAHAPIRIYQTERSTQIPDSFPEMNAGVVLFKQSPQFDNFIRNWLVLYRQDIDQYADPYDQASFRKSLYESDLRIGTLTSEYNFRFIFPAYACKTVKIFHGRHPDLPSLAAEINKDLVYRVYIPGEGVIKRKYKTNFFRENHQC
ncbi:hypothetical protein [Microcoleus sp. N3A4]|uniref:hypothetical protein n=1 Tax=Microcoleus sp. N3A4 TaxID=3055379 RepID=UPI002FD2472D